jgi:hypothetical protein
MWDLALQVMGMDGRSAPAVLRDSQLGTGSSSSSSPQHIHFHDFHGVMRD